MLLCLLFCPSCFLVLALYSLCQVSICYQISATQREGTSLISQSICRTVCSRYLPDRNRGSTQVVWLQHTQWKQTDGVHSVANVPRNVPWQSVLLLQTAGEAGDENSLSVRRVCVIPWWRVVSIHFKVWPLTQIVFINSSSAPPLTTTAPNAVIVINTVVMVVIDFS